MRHLITIFILVLTFTCQGQRIDTTAMYLPCVDTTSFYLIYNASGKVVRTETSLQPWSIPSGGWASQDRFINPSVYNMVGYIIQETVNGSTITTGYLNSKKLPIAKPYLVLSKEQLQVLLK